MVHDHVALRPPTFLPASHPRLPTPTVSAARTDCESMTAADGSRSPLQPRECNGRHHVDARFPASTNEPAVFGPVVGRPVASQSADRPRPAAPGRAGIDLVSPGPLTGSALSAVGAARAPTAAALGASPASSHRRAPGRARSRLGSPEPGFALPVQPGRPDVIQIPAGLLLHVRREVRRGRVAVTMVRAQPRRMRKNVVSPTASRTRGAPSRRARTPAGRRCRRRTADRPAGKPSSARRRTPRRSCAPAGTLIHLLRPEPFRVRREALAEPHVPPGLRGHRVPEPLVRQLVDERADADGPREEGPGLGLQGVVGVVPAADDHAGGGERIRPEGLLPPLHDLGQLARAGPRSRPPPIGSTAVYEVIRDRAGPGPRAGRDCCVRYGPIATVAR